MELLGVFADLVSDIGHSTIAIVEMREGIFSSYYIDYISDSIEQFREAGGGLSRSKGLRFSVRAFRAMNRGHLRTVTDELLIRGLLS